MTDREVDPDKYLQECMQIESCAIEEEFIRLPGDLSYWNARYAEVYRHWREMQLAREQISHLLWSEHQTKLLAEAATKTPSGTSKNVRVLKDEIVSAVERDPDFTKARKREIAAESEKIRLHGVMEAIRAKKEMLISLGAHMRLEMSNDPAIRRQAALSAAIAREGGL